MSTVTYYGFNTPLGELYVASSSQGLCRVELNGEDREAFFYWLNKHFDKVEENYEKNKGVIEQIIGYTKEEIKTFETKLHLMGTDFQKKVWKELLKIPYGEVCSYKDIARRVGSPLGFRAVGMANNKNNIPIIIPCHRVIGHNGDLVGYGGGLDMKISLLTLEKVKIVDQKVVAHG